MLIGAPQAVAHSSISQHGALIVVVLVFRVGGIAHSGYGSRLPRTLRQRMRLRTSSGARSISRKLSVAETSASLRSTASLIAVGVGIHFVEREWLSAAQCRA